MDSTKQITESFYDFINEDGTYINKNLFDEYNIIFPTANINEDDMYMEAYYLRYYNSLLYSYDYTLQVNFDVQLKGGNIKNIKKIIFFKRQWYYINNGYKPFISLLMMLIILIR
ncbi:MAG: hypothetical protein LBG26_04325 [Treponema sp.]|nr:hypothetical protein [Treponema sp.]